MFQQIERFARGLFGLAGLGGFFWVELLFGFHNQLGERISLLGEIIQNALNASGQNGIHYLEVAREGKHGDNYHCRRALHLLPVRPGDFAHLHSEAVVIVPRGIDKVLLFLCHILLLAENDIPNPSPERLCGAVGRGGGIRTPTRGFGDRWSAVKPTPLGPTPRRAGGPPFILLDFLMGLMLSAMTTELTELDAFRRGLLVLGRRIVPVFTLRALERNDFAW